MREREKETGEKRLENGAGFERVVGWEGRVSERRGRERVGQGLREW